MRALPEKPRAIVVARGGAGEFEGGHVAEQAADHDSKNREVWAFILLTVVIAPVMSVVIVGGYGFLVWMYQLLAGPPGS